MKNKNCYKMAAIFALVLATVSSLWFASPTAISYAQGGYAEAGGGGGAGEVPSSYTYLAEKTNENGVFNSDATAISGDELCKLTIKKGTKALTRASSRLVSILIVKKAVALPAPSNSKFASIVYDITPAGTTFDPPITISFTYKTSDIPKGVDEKNLVIAYWDGNKWAPLEGITVDTSKHTISGLARHFTAFTVIAYTSPAAFTASNLTISPAEVTAGESVSISVTITNTGDLSGSHDVTLKVDNSAVATKQVTLDGHASQQLTFTTTNNTVGSHTVSVNGVSGSFTVKEAPPAPAPTPTPTPAPTPAPAPAPSPAPAPAPAPTPAPPTPAPTPAPPVTPVPTLINWWLIGGIIGAVIVIAVAVWLVLVSRRD